MVLRVDLRNKKAENIYRDQHIASMILAGHDGCVALEEGNFKFALMIPTGVAFAESPTHPQPITHLSLLDDVGPRRELPSCLRVTQQHNEQLPGDYHT